MWTSARPVVEERGTNIKITSNKRDEPLTLQWNRSEVAVAYLMVQSRHLIGSE